ncbi:hypothetical protein Bca4012_100296 [Brassica carinata]|uniref:Uncharacterized protein n=1 Tax=Brassica carinata TaxID=52824 RepID=A0A8X7TSZ7_BRACI|nr:hypothetical protein Bca52824_082840 [Brassica carinata]
MKDETVEVRRLGSHLPSPLNTSTAELHMVNVSKTGLNPLHATIKGTTAYDLYPLSAKYERSWMPLFPEIDCQEKLWSRVFVIESAPASLI